MLKPAAMVKVKVIGLKVDQEDAVKLLHENGSLEIKKFTDARLSPTKAPEKLGEVSELMAKLKSIENNLKPQKLAGLKTHSTEQAIKEACELKVGEEISALIERKSKITEEKNRLSASQKLLKNMKGIDVKLELLRGTGAAFFIGRIQTQKIAETRSAIEHITSKFALTSKEINKFESLAILAADKKKEPELSTVLNKMGFAREELVEGKGTPEELGAKVAADLENLKKEEKDIEEKTAELSKKNYAKVVGLRKALELQANRLDIVQNFGSTSHTFMLEAWCPKAKYNSVKNELNKAFGKSIDVSLVKTKEMPPTLLKNPRILNPFQFLVEFMAVPKGKEIDPTLLFALVFPIFYGMMLGDFGYGVMSLALGIFAIKMLPGVFKDLGRVIAYVSVPTMIFGIIYDEFLGFTHTELLGTVLYHGIERLHEVQFLLLVTILLGITHITLGYILGFIEEMKHKNTKHALGKLGWIGIEFAAIVLIGAFLAAELFPMLLVYAAVPVGIIGLGLVYLAEGFQGVIELPTLASNILSYSRILAIGLSSLSIAFVINLIANPANNLLLLPIFIIGHFINLILGVFESFIQAARLNYVEFFSKFYAGGGKKFNPFTMKEKETTL